MLIWQLAAALLVPWPTLEEARPLEVRFADWCAVERATWANDCLYLLVRNMYHPEVGMSVYVNHRRLYHWCGPLDLRDECGIGRDPAGRLINVKRQRAPGREKLKFAISGQPGAHSSRLVGAVDTDDEEGLVSFLPSRPGTFITNWRVGRVGAALEEFRSVRFSERLVSFQGAADASGDRVLAGTSGPRQRASPKRTGGLWWIDPATGKVTPVRLLLVTTTAQESPPSEVELLNPGADQVSGVLANPHKTGWFYVALGELFRGGRLLHVGPEDQCEVVFRRETGPFEQIPGVPDHPPRYVGVSREEAVLALACDARQMVHFMTPRGVYRLGQAGPEFVGVPDFEELTNFYVARNIPGFILVLSCQGTLADTESRVHMVPVPHASTTQTSSSPDHQYQGEPQSSMHNGDEDEDE